MCNNAFCKAPFFYIEVARDGSIYPCCPILSCSFGNIEKEHFDVIWNGEIAKKFRQSVQLNEYKYCKTQMCNPLNNRYSDKIKLTYSDNDYNLETSYPTFVKFTHDSHCNIKCITCRDDYQTNSYDRMQELNKKIDNLYIPILKNAQVVSMCGAGEALASKHCRTLIKRIAEIYPDIKFEIHTNGILCDEKNLKELGILDKLIGIDVSMHGYNQKTVEKIMVGTNYDLVMKNLKWIASLKKEGMLKSFNFCYVVNNYNYLEMKDFLKFALDLGADVYFWEYRKWGTSIDKEYDKFAVFEKTHKNYNKLVKLLEDDLFKDSRCHLQNRLNSLKKITVKEKFKNASKNLFNNYILEEKNKKHRVVKIFGIKFKFKVGG